MLQHRRSEGVVDHQRRAGLVQDVGDGGDVDHLQRRIGRAFEEGGLGVGADRRLPGGEIGSLDQRRGDAETRQQLLDDVKTRAEQRPRGDDMVAGLELAHQRRGHRRHAAGGGARRLGALEQRHALLEHRDGRIGEARIDEARRVAFEARLRLRHRVVEIALGEEQRLRGLLELRTHRAAVHQTGGGAQRARIAGLAGAAHGRSFHGRRPRPSKGFRIGARGLRAPIF